MPLTAEARGCCRGHALTIEIFTQLSHLRPPPPPRQKTAKYVFLSVRWVLGFIAVRLINRCIVIVRAAPQHSMPNEGPLEEMHPRLCADPCRLTGLKRRHELNEHLVDRIKPLAFGRVSVLPLSRSAQP